MRERLLGQASQPMFFSQSSNNVGNCATSQTPGRPVLEVGAAHLVIGWWNPIEHLEAVQGSLASLGLMGQHPWGQRGTGSSEELRDNHLPSRASSVASDGSACRVFSWLGNSNTSGRRSHHRPPAPPTSPHAHSPRTVRQKMRLGARKW